MRGGTIPWATACALALTACGGGEGGLPEAGPPRDAGPLADAASGPDARTPDGGRPGPDAAPSPDGATPDAGSDAGDTTPACPAGAPLLREDGPLLEITSPGERRSFDFGTVGTRYARILVAVDVVLGPWRMDLFDRSVLNHNLFGLFRNAPVSRERYLLGLGAQIHPSDAGLAPTALFFGRVDLDPRPMGMGYTAYTTFRAPFPWEPGAAYRAEVLLDAVAHRQILELRRDGVVVLRLEGAIDYFDAALTDAGFRFELGSEETSGRDVSPVGARFSDLLVCGEPI